MSNREIPKNVQKQMLLELLGLIAERCEALGCRYFLFWGSLIGAVRDQMMMPWDDDIDLGMPRPDYERFVKDILAHPLAENVNLIDWRHPVRDFYPYQMAKVGRSDTVIRAAGFGKKFELELAIDIFPMDGFPDDPAEREAFHEKNAEYLPLIYQCAFRAADKWKKYPILNFLNWLVWRGRIRFKLPHLMREQEKYITAYDFDKAQLVGNPGNVVPGACRVEFQREGMVRTIPAAFEGDFYQIPIGYDAELRTIYGDYSQLPPPEARVSHDYDVVEWRTDAAKKQEAVYLEKLADKDEETLPEAWKPIIYKSDGSRKKVILYNTTAAGLLGHGDEMLEKYKRAFEDFKAFKDDIALIWRPHPLIASTIPEINPELWTKYSDIVKEFRQAGWGIYDDTADIHRAIDLADAYYGDGSSAAVLMNEGGKPAMIQDPEY